MKYFIIQVRNNVFYRYGGNTKDLSKALKFAETDIAVIQKIMSRYTNPKLLEVRS